MNLVFNKIFCLILAFFIIDNEPEVPSTAKQILDRMLANIENVKGLKYTIKVYERVNGNITSSENNVKMYVEPFKVYLSTVAPSPGVQILYINGQNNGKALVKPNSFPYISLDLDPYSSLLVKSNHHTLNEMGFNYFADVITYGMNKNLKSFDEIFKYKGSTTWEGRPCHVLNIEYPDYKHVSYTVKPGENVISIAKSLRVGEYKIKEINNLKDYNSVKTGQVIKVPNVYAKKTVIYVDKVSGLPVVLSMYDEIGLYEKYEYRNLVVNPQFATNEFSKSCPGYSF